MRRSHAQGSVRLKHQISDLERCRKSVPECPNCLRIIQCPSLFDLGAPIQPDPQFQDTDFWILGVSEIGNGPGWPWSRGSTPHRLFSNFFPYTYTSQKKSGIDLEVRHVPSRASTAIANVINIYIYVSSRTCYFPDLVCVLSVNGKAASPRLCAWETATTWGWRWFRSEISTILVMW